MGGVCVYVCVGGGRGVGVDNELILAYLGCFQWLQKKASIINTTIILLTSWTLIKMTSFPATLATPWYNRLCNESIIDFSICLGYLIIVCVNIISYTSTSQLIKAGFCDIVHSWFVDLYINFVVNPMLLTHCPCTFTLHSTMRDNNYYCS